MVSNNLEHSFCPTMRSNEDLLSCEVSLNYRITRLELELIISFLPLLCVLWDRDLAFYFSLIRFTTLILCREDSSFLNFCCERSIGAQVWLFRFSLGCILRPRDLMLLTWESSFELVRPSIYDWIFMPEDSFFVLL